VTRKYAVKRVGDRVVLPATADETNYRSFSTWSDSDNALRRFLAISLGGRELESEYVRVEVRLVHRPDNEYNPMRSPS
jgi:hypothetical protein